MAVLIRDVQTLVPIDKRRLRRSLTRALIRMGCRGCELSVLLVDDPRIREMNRSYRGVDTPTNVLAFGVGEGMTPGEQPRVLGDVVVSVETARRECCQWGHEVEPHVLYLALHGLLHLLGYDDEGSIGRARQMSAVLEELFSACGCAQGPF